MDRVKLSIGCAVTVAAIALAVLLPKLRHQPPVHTDGNTAVTLAARQGWQAAGRSGGGTSKAKALATPTTPSGGSYKGAFNDSRDYWEYASRVLPAARAGDPDAQFYLSRALERCQSDLRMYLQQKGRPLTEGESLQWAAKRHLPLELAQQAYERCHRFQQEHGTGQFGNATEWLGWATLAGQPVAQATTATQILLQQKNESFAKAEAVPVTIPIAPDTAHMDPRALFREAVESGDPEVLFQIGTADALLHPSTGMDNVTEFSWWLVACEEGLDCSPDADWVKNACYLDPQCASAVSPSDLVEHLAGNDWPEVQQRAQELKAKLDAHQWDDLGLGGKDQ